jgi:hypothetical protein
MNIHPDAGRNVMQYIRDLEGKLIRCRNEQAGFKFRSFVAGFVVGMAIAAATAYFIFRG